jgi:hypothetical protein
VRIERQVFLSRGGRFAMLGDAIANAPQCSIEYRSRLPLWTSSRAVRYAPTRECRILAEGGPTVRVFPLALPRDPVSNSPGTLTAVGGHLELRQTTTEGGLFAPLILDWHPERRRSSAEWRALTITEDRQVISFDQAAAYRLRLGKSQFLLYRSLMRSPIARAVIGFNTRYETVLGRFTPTGEVEPLVQIE